jgi:hypothetical protein
MNFHVNRNDRHDFIDFTLNWLNKKNQTIEEKIIKHKQKKTQQQAKNNTKSYQGFGYTYKPFQSNLNK